MMTLNKLANMFSAFKDRRIMVIGDVMLDEYIYGNINRISPEAPVPIFEKVSNEFRLGGAGNVALNLNALGASVFLIGMRGAMNIPDELFANRNISFHSPCIKSYYIEEMGKKTIHKVRYIANKQQVLRVDDENLKPINEHTQSLALQKIIKNMESFQPECVVISDYNKGFIGNWIQEITAICRSKNIPIIADPKPVSDKRYYGMTAITPNLKEFKQMTGITQITDIIEHWKHLKNKLQLSELILTESEMGMRMVDKDEFLTHSPAKALEVSDVSGAGDTALAAIALCYAVPELKQYMLPFANLCAGVAVGKHGTSVVNYQQVINYYKDHFNKGSIRK